MDSPEKAAPRVCVPRTVNGTGQFTLALSGEHTGFTFERDLAKAETMIRLHSGGENAFALRALRGGRGDARELLATTHGPQPTDCAAACATA